MLDTSGLSTLNCLAETGCELKNGVAFKLNHCIGEVIRYSEGRLLEVHTLNGVGLETQELVESMIEQVELYNLEASDSEITFLGSKLENSELCEKLIEAFPDSTILDLLSSTENVKIVKKSKACSMAYAMTLRGAES